MLKQTYSQRVRGELASIHPLYAIPDKARDAIRANLPTLAACEARGDSPRKAARAIMAADNDTPPASDQSRRTAESTRAKLASTFNGGAK